MILDNSHLGGLNSVVYSGLMTGLHDRLQHVCIFIETTIAPRITILTSHKWAKYDTKVYIHSDYIYDT